MDEKKQLNEILALSGNTKCCDCGDLRPTWGSILVPPKAAPAGSHFIGAFVCLHCSASHRSLGTHVCTVRSVTLDEWTDRDVQAMRLGGNLRVNSIFEGCLFDDSVKPTPLVDAASRESFVREKYVNLKYFVPAAYKVVGTEDEEDEQDDGISSEAQDAISVLASSSLQSKLESSSCSTDLLNRTTTTTRSIKTQLPSRRTMMHRQSSLPTIRSPSMSLDKAFARPTNIHNNPSDFYESMSNSQWGNMTFEESLHDRSILETKSTTDAWNISGHQANSMLKCSQSEADNDKRRRKMGVRPKSARSLFGGGRGGEKRTRTSSRNRNRIHRQSSTSRLPSFDEEKKDDGPSSSKTSTLDVLHSLEEANRNRIAEQKASGTPRQLQRQLLAPVKSPRKNDVGANGRASRSRSFENKRRAMRGDRGNEARLLSMSLSHLKTPKSRRQSPSSEEENAALSMSYGAITEPFLGTAAVPQPPPPPSLPDNEDPISLMLSPEPRQRRHRASKSPRSRARSKSGQSRRNSEGLAKQRSLRKLAGESPTIKKPVRPTSFQYQSQSTSNTNAIRRVNSLDAIAKSRRRHGQESSRTTSILAYTSTPIPPSPRKMHSKSPRTSRGRKAAIVHSLNQALADEIKSTATKEKVSKGNTRPRSLDISRRRKERRAQLKQKAALRSASDHPQKDKQDENGDDDINSDDDEGCLLCHPSFAIESKSTSTASSSRSSLDHDSASSFANNSFSIIHQAAY